MRKPKFGSVRWLNEHALFSHLCGDKFSNTHKFSAGTVIMMVGVVVAKSAVYFELHIIHIVFDMAGYLLHGIGAIPFAEHVIKKGGSDGISK